MENEPKAEFVIHNDEPLEKSISLENEKLEKIDKERQEILSKVSSFTVASLRERVAWILNHYPETRDSDRLLQIKYWGIFESQLYSGGILDPATYLKLTALNSISRERARLQNQYKLFLASPQVREKRGTLSEEEKEKAFEERPLGLPVYTVYLDESGKNADNYIVGGVWFLSDYFTVHRAVLEVIKRHNFKKEFHFKEMREADLPIYRDLIETFINFANNVSFNIISIPRRGIKTTDHAAFASLYYHLLIKGISHEINTGRAPLPRSLQIWLDAEETSSDQLMLANLSDGLTQASHSLFDRKLYIGDFYPISSKHNIMLQVSDLLVSSANRLLNRPGERRNHKDEFAEYFMDLLNIQLDGTSDEKIGDMAVYQSLQRMSKSEDKGISKAESF